MASLALFSFYFLGSPLDGVMPLIIVFSFILIGSIFAITCIESVFSKNLPKEIRGTMNGVQTFVGTIGSMWFTILGGYICMCIWPESSIYFSWSFNNGFCTFCVSCLINWEI